MKLHIFAIGLSSMILSACIDAEFKSDWTAEQIASTAAQVKQDEIVLYGSDDCPYCKQAKQWFEKHGFAYKDCEMNKSEQCYNEYKALNGNGVPFIVINRNGKQQIMQNGFDSDELMTLLQSE